MNLTHKWSRAVFDLGVGVAYGENVDEVMNVLLALGKEFREDPKFADMILDDMEMLGLDSFGDSAVMIKFFIIKTKPMKQWIVRRELNRRIKNKFDELGIEIPFPRQMVYHRTQNNQRIHPLEQLAHSQDKKAA
jgi:small conductance mechanosensitive channel